MEKREVNQNNQQVHKQDLPSTTNSPQQDKDKSNCQFLIIIGKENSR